MPAIEVTDEVACANNERTIGPNHDVRHPIELDSPMPPIGATFARISLAQRDRRIVSCIRNGAGLFETDGKARAGPAVHQLPREGIRSGIICFGRHPVGRRFHEGIRRKADSFES